MQKMRTIVRRNHTTRQVPLGIETHPSLCAKAKRCVGDADGFTLPADPRSEHGLFEPCVRAMGRRL